jgi:hypothetical protein
MRHLWTNPRTAQHAPASGGRNGASRLDGPLAGLLSAHPDRPCGPPLSPRLRRGSPCGSIRARGARKVSEWSTTVLACREGASGRIDIFAWASPAGVRQAEGKTSRGAGGRLRNAGQRAGAVHALVGWAAQPSTGGRGNHDGGRGALVLGQHASSTKPNGGGYGSVRILQRRTRGDPDFQRAEIVSVSCPDSMSDKRGLGGFRLQLRHAKAWRVVDGNCQAPTPQGSRRIATRGWFGADF